MDSLAGIPGLIRECSPGRLVEHPDVPAEHVGKTCTVGRLVGPWAGVVLEGCSVVVSVPVGAIALDLAQETGRAHAAVYITRRIIPLPLDGLRLTNCALGYAECDADRLRDLVLQAAECCREADRG